MAKIEGYYGEYYETANGRINYSVYGDGEEKYYMIGHSISGLYALNYCKLYEDEVLGFIGIDAFGTGR